MKTDPKSFYGYANRFKKKNSNIGPLRVDGNEFFFGGLTEEYLHEDEIKEEDVKAAISKLLSNSAGGADGLTSRIVKLFKDEILEPFRLVFNNSLSTGEQLEKEYSTVCCPLLKPK